MKLNDNLSRMIPYTSKLISDFAKKNPDITGLSFGEPVFGPPEHLKSKIIKEGLSYESFVNSVKSYEKSEGSLELRKAISKWYSEKYNLNIDYDSEIMITHGGVEAISLAILCTSNKDDTIFLTSPTYMLYERTIETLNRNVVTLDRTITENEYSDLNFKRLTKPKAIVINSPENPSGYILSNSDWNSILSKTSSDCWIIHDVVYDVMSYKREHIPAIKVPELKDRSIMINSFSKKFGIPGLRIGWMVAPKEIINLAKKAHDYLYLGVNIQYEKIATLLLEDDQRDYWLKSQADIIKNRISLMTSTLGVNQGFCWSRKPHGAMFLFPEVSGLYKIIPTHYKEKHNSVGEAVSDYLLHEIKVATVPGSVYGEAGKNHIRLVACSDEITFNDALKRLKEIDVTKSYQQKEAITY